jgi:hypothetical protein
MDKNNISKAALIILLFALLNTNYAQELYKLPGGLSLSNHLEYSYNSDKQTEIFENWLNLDYTYGIFSAGLRFEVFQPNDPDPSISRGKEKYSDIAYKYIQAKIGNRREGLFLTVGNYYEMFGRGLVLKSYEDRNIRIDNNLSGFKVEGMYGNFILKALTGMAANANNERKDILHAADLEYRGVKKLKLGFSLSSNIPDEVSAANTALASLRLNANLWNFDFYGEYGVKHNEDISNQISNGEEAKVGEGIYSNLSFYYGPFSISGEYKLYDNFLYSSLDGTIQYNTPPSLTMDYSYILLNRHPYPLNANNENGYQLSAIYNFTDDTYLTGNYSYTRSLGGDSYYQQSLGINIDSQSMFEDFYFQYNQGWSSSFESILAFGYREEKVTNTKSITPIIEGKYYFDDINTFRLVFEHQHVTEFNTDEEYYTDLLLLEYLRSPKLSISLVAEMQTKEPEANNTERKFWGFVQLGYKLAEHTDLRLLIGSRQAGNICVGGVCRYEPEFEGIELVMFTRLY